MSPSLSSISVLRAALAGLLLCGLFTQCSELRAAERASRTRSGRAAPTDTGKAASAPVQFAPVSADHPLASIWNDPDFTRRLIGSYGFHSPSEPRLSAEEQVLYRDKIVPLLREDPKKAVPELVSAARPEASAVFDFTLGTVYFQSEDFTNAVKHFEQALAKFPDYLRAQKNLALALVRSGDYEAAIKPLARTITLGGADGAIYGLLGFAYMNRGQYVSAEAAYRQAALFDPDNLDFKLGLVKCQIAQANYDAALALLDELIQRHPDRDVFWRYQVNIFILREQYARAAVNYEILRRMDKAHAEDLMKLGDIYMMQESKELALSAYQSAFEKDTQNAALALKAVEVLTSRGAWSEARAMLAKIRQAGALDGDAELKLLKLESKVALAEGEGGTAIEVLERIIQRNPLDGEALLMAGDYYAKNGEPEKAGFRFDTAARITGFEADAWLKQAQLLVQSQKYPQAVELLRKAQKVRPRDNVQRYLEKVEQIALNSRG